MTHFQDPDAGRSFARYLGLSMEEVGEVRPGGAEVRGVVPVIDHLRIADGSIALGALLGLADSVAGLCSGLAALPGWIVSTNVMLRAVADDAVGPLELRAGVLRAGRHSVVTAVTIHDSGAQDRLLADGSLTSAVLQPADGPPIYARPLRLDLLDADLGAVPPLDEFLGARVTAPDTLTIPITDAVRNPWGILHGAATAALVDLAALHVTGACRTTDAVLHFLAPGRVGPVRATGSVIGTRADGHVVRVEIRDVGADDRPLAFAIVTARD